MLQLQSSISDTQRYKNICQMAALNDFYFSFFKQNKDYTEILEHVSEDQGKLYKEHLDQNFPEYISKLDKFKENDLYGGTKLFNYDSIGQISPTTLRYIKVLSDLKQLYGSLDNFNIIEIGVGYGGQCKIISDFFNIQNYYLVDLDESLNLSEKYLNKLDVKSAKVVRPNDVVSLNKKFDLVISNYAFTEISRTIQDFYLNNIILKSDRGYITCNFISQYCNIDSYSLKELEAKLNNFSTKKLQEFPLTHKDNLILYW
jgi:putative sugar O-methyltransferase